MKFASELSIWVQNADCEPKNQITAFKTKKLNRSKAETTHDGILELDIQGVVGFWVPGLEV